MTVNSVVKPAPPAATLLSCHRNQTETNSDCARFDDHRYLAAAIRMLKHTGETFIVLENVDIFESNFAPGEILTGSRSIGAEILPKDQHGFAGHRFAPFAGLINQNLTMKARQILYFSDRANRNKAVVGKKCLPCLCCASVQSVTGRLD
jgi:hypothetical protein